MNKALSYLIILLAAALLLVPELALAQQGQEMSLIARKAVVLYVQGDVMVRSRRMPGKWLDATTGMTLKQGESLKTGRQSWAELGVVTDFENVVRVRESTVVKLIDLRPIKIGLLEGEVRSLVEGLGVDSTFEIETPTAVCGARGTGWDTRTDGRKSEVDTYEEDVYFQPLKEGAQKKIVKAGKRGILEGIDKEITIKDLPIEKIREWNRWKDDYMQRRPAAKEKTAVKDRVRGIRQKAEKAETARKTIEDVTKAHESRLDRKDSDRMEKRIDDKKSSSSDKNHYIEQ